MLRGLPAGRQGTQTNPTIQLESCLVGQKQETYRDNSAGKTGWDSSPGGFLYKRPPHLLHSLRSVEEYL